MSYCNQTPCPPCGGWDLAIAHNRKSREGEGVTLVAVVTAESPACTINLFMPAYMASLSKCEILIGSSFSIARGLNGHAKKCFRY